MAAVMLGAFLLGASPAFADDVEVPLDDAARESTAEMAAEGTFQNGQVYLVEIPYLSWRDISDDASPALASLAGHYACANLIAADDAPLDEFKDSESFHYAQLDGYSLEQADDYVYSIYADLSPADTLIVTSSPTFAENTFDFFGYTPLIVVDAGDNGLLTSSTTTREGLVISNDLTDAVRALLVSPQKNPANLSVFGLTYTMSGNARISHLEKEASTAVSIEESTSRFTVIFVAWMIVTFAFSVVLLFLEIKIRPRFLKFVIPFTRILWVVAISFPIASYLMFILLPSVVTPGVALLFCLAWVALLSFVALLVGFLRRWLYAPLSIFLVTTVALVGDQLLGGPLTSCGYLSYSPIEVTRYFGIGNEGAALLFGSWIMLASLLLNRFPVGRYATVFKRWIFPAASLFVIAVIAAPWWGANFGVIIWGTVGAIVAWALLNERRITWKSVAFVVLAAGFLALAVLVLDTTFNAESHMGAQLGSLTGAWYTSILTVIGDMLVLSWNTVLFSPPLAVMFIFIFAFLIYLRVAKPGPYAQFWKRNVPFKAAFTSLLVTAGLMLLVEDSGILMPALLLLYAMCGLIWLVCDLHRWHLRQWIERHTRLEFAEPAPVSELGVTPYDDGPNDVPVSANDGDMSTISNNLGH